MESNAEVDDGRRPMESDAEVDMGRRIWRCCEQRGGDAASDGRAILLPWVAGLATWGNMRCYKRRPAVLPLRGSDATMARWHCYQ
jgi:hypothetical protein